jgi:hypothetical protein
VHSAASESGVSDRHVPALIGDAAAAARTESSHATPLHEPRLLAVDARGLGRARARRCHSDDLAPGPARSPTRGGSLPSSFAFAVMLIGRATPFRAALAGRCAGRPVDGRRLWGTYGNVQPHRAAGADAFETVMRTVEPLVRLLSTAWALRDDPASVTPRCLSQGTSRSGRPPRPDRSSERARRGVSRAPQRRESRARPRGRPSGSRR